MLDSTRTEITKEIIGQPSYTQIMNEQDLHAPQLTCDYGDTCEDEVWMRTEIENPIQSENGFIRYPISTYVYCMYHYRENY